MARTIADLEGEERVTVGHVGEAIQYHNHPVTARRDR
jgi:predicted ATPase with chaperone activity